MMTILTFMSIVPLLIQLMAGVNHGQMPDATM
jgi:hypothetical protein